MQLTQFTDYSLRALIYIAIKKDTCTIKDITRSYSISNNHMIKIIHNLAKLGLIQTKRGKNGGILLAVNPECINLGTLIIQLEKSFDLVPCFKGISRCSISPACKLKHLLYEAQNAFLKTLAGYTLADILQNEHELMAILT